MNRVLSRPLPSRLAAAGALLALAGCARDARPAPRPADPPPEGAASSAQVAGPGTPRRADFPVGFGDREVRAEALLTFAARGRGFSGRAAMRDDEALLFVYPTPDLRSYWMKGCAAALDILYLADDGEVLELKTMPPPAPGVAEDDLPRFRGTRPVRLVLEVRAGLAAAAGVRVGARVRLPPDVAALFKSAESS